MVLRSLADEYGYLLPGGGKYTVSEDGSATGQIDIELGESLKKGGLR